jgi:precorrin-6y C5,15-methyltransferase (decarboxylating) CbiE subunit
MPKNKLFVVGVGPGAKGYITETAKKIIKNADLVAGFGPAINIIRDLINRRAEIIVLDYASEKLKLNLIASKLREPKRCVICCAGDPNFSDQQFIKKIRQVFGQIEVIPGISSVQIAAALAGLALEDIRFITFHKSGSLKAEKTELVKALRAGKNIILLPRPWDFMPGDIARFLVRKGVPTKIRISVYENLTLENEAVSDGSLKDVLEKDFSDLSVMIIKQNRLRRSSKTILRSPP